MNKKSFEVQSLMRALDIMDTILKSETHLSLKKITEIVNLPKPTVYRLISNLTERGYASLDIDGNYQIGHKFILTNTHQKEFLSLKAKVNKFLIELRDYSEETVNLGVLYGDKVLYVDAVESTNQIRLVSEIGGTTPLNNTGLGKALLFSHEENEIRRLLKLGGMEKNTDMTICDVDEFIDEVFKSKKKGFAVDEMEYSVDCRCVAAPIYDTNGKVIAAISVSGPIPRYTVEKSYQVGEKLIEVADRIKHLLNEDDE